MFAQFCCKGLVCSGEEICCNRPVFFRLEGINLTLAVDNNAHRHRLDSARAQSRFDLGPEQWTQLVSDDAVKDPAGLLCIHQILADGPGTFDGLLHRILRDLSELNPALIFVYLQDMGKVPSDGLALPVRVRGNQDAVRFLGRLPQFLEDWTFAANGNVFWFKVVFNIYAKLAAGEVTHMAH